MANLLDFKLTLEDLLGPKLAALATRVEAFGKKVEKPHKVKIETEQASGGLSSLMGMAGKAFAAFGIFEAVTGIAKMGADLEQTRVQFETFTGSAEKGNAVIAELQKFAQITPFEDDQVIKAGRQLLAFGERAENLNPILSKLGNISSATGKDFNELVSLWGKNKLSGIIQGEDLNQLVDSGIPVMDSLAKQLGVNTSQVRKMGEQGKITFGMLDKSFDELGGPAGKWGDLMDKQSKTVAGQWSSLVGLAQNMGGKLGESLAPVTAGIVQIGFKLLELASKAPKFFNDYKYGFMALAVVVAALSAETLILAGIQKAQALYTTLATSAQWLLNAAMTANPIGLVIAGVAALIAVFAVLYKKTEGMRGLIDGFAAGAKSAFVDLAQAAVKIFGGLGTLIKGLFTLDKSAMAKGLTEALEGIKQAGPASVAAKAGQAYGKAYQKGVLAVRAEKAADALAEKAPNAAAAFLNKKPGGMAGLAPGLKAATKEGTAGAGGGSKVTNITLRIDTLIKEMKISAATVSEGADELADVVLKKLMSSLNDVNTLASSN